MLLNHQSFQFIKLLLDRNKVPKFRISFSSHSNIAGTCSFKKLKISTSYKFTVAIAYVLTGILGLCAVLLTVSGSMKALILLSAIVVVGAIGFKVIMSGKMPHRKHHEQSNPQQAEGQTPEEEQGGTHEQA